jgi:PIN domain nuclease of toxin-antitoxin system
MSDYVLDTHACIFVLREPTKLGALARKALDRVEKGIERALIPAAVVAEIVMLNQRGRIGVGFGELRETFEDISRFQFLPMDLPQLEQFVALGSVRDPFDRFIVAAARATGARLISKDVALQESGLVSVIWS